jgi:hypothetical protein
MVLSNNFTSLGDFSPFHHQDFSKIIIKFDENLLHNTDHKGYTQSHLKPR